MDRTEPRERHGRLILAITTWLDLAGLLAVAVGAGWGLWPHVGAWSLLPAGAVLWAGSAFAASRLAPAVPADERRRARAMARARKASAWLNGRRRARGEAAVA